MYIYIQYTSTYTYIEINMCSYMTFLTLLHQEVEQLVHPCQLLSRSPDRVIQST